MGGDRWTREEMDEDRIAELETALRWYGEQARLCRLIHSEGDAGRHALAADGGAKARTALKSEDRVGCSNTNENN